MIELKRKMRELTRRGGAATEARRQGLKWSDQEARGASSSDLEDGGIDQGEFRTRSGMQKVTRMTGKSPISEGQGGARKRGETIVKSEPEGARLKPKSKSASDSGKEEIVEEKKCKKVKLEKPSVKVIVKKQKLTDSEEAKKDEKSKKLNKKKSKKVKKELSLQESENEDSES